MGRAQFRQGDVLFKYTTPHYARRLVEKGATLVGTLFKFRDEEELGKVIGDAGEGTISRETGPMNLRAGEPVPRAVKDFLRGDVHGVELREVGFQRVEHTGNRYVYCTSRSFSEMNMRAFGGACVRIDDPLSFFTVITRLLGPPVSGFSVRSCDYASRTIGYEEPAHPEIAFLKDIEYAYQDEVRAVWSPPMRQIVPREVRNKRLTDFCTLLHAGPC